MSQCVPSWDLDDPPNPKAHLRFNHLPSPAPLVPMSDYEVAELTWENGHLALHSLGHHRIEKPIPKDPSSSSTAAAWEKPPPSGTLESVVDQATRAQLFPPAPSPDFAAWLRPGPEPHRSSPPVMDALVPCAAAPRDDAADPGFGRKRARVGEAGLVCASQGSAAAPVAGRGGESTLVTLDTCGGDDVGFTTTNNTNTNTNSASPSRAEGEGEDGGSPETENTSFGGGGGRGRGGRPLAFDDLDSVCLSRRSQAASSLPPSSSSNYNFYRLCFSVFLITYLWLWKLRRTGHAPVKRR